MFGFNLDVVAYLTRVNFIGKIMCRFSLFSLILSIFLFVEHRKIRWPNRRISIVVRFTFVWMCVSELVNVSVLLKCLYLNVDLLLLQLFNTKYLSSLKSWNISKFDLLKMFICSHLEISKRRVYMQEWDADEKAHTSPWSISNAIDLNDTCRHYLRFCLKSFVLSEWMCLCYFIHLFLPLFCMISS